LSYVYIIHKLKAISTNSHILKGVFNCYSIHVVLRLFLDLWFSLHLSTWSWLPSSLTALS